MGKDREREQKQIDEQIQSGSETAVVGKLKILFPQHIPLPTTQQVTDTAYLLKECRVGRFTLFTLDLWEGRGRRYDGFLLWRYKIESFDTNIKKIDVAGSILEKLTYI
jgi:hypothetical protein